MARSATHLLPRKRGEQLPMPCKQLRAGCRYCTALGIVWEALNFGVVSASARENGRPTGRLSRL